MANYDTFRHEYKTLVAFEEVDGESEINNEERVRIYDLGRGDRGQFKEIH